MSGRFTNSLIVGINSSDMCNNFYVQKNASLPSGGTNGFPLDTQTSIGYLRMVSGPGSWT